MQPVPRGGEGEKMRLKRFVLAGLVTAALAFVAGAIVYAAAAPAGPGITVYRSPT